MGILSDEHASWKLLAKELDARGYTVSEAYENDHLYVSFQSPSGAVWRTRAARLNYPVTSEKAQLLARDKDAATQFVVSKGLSAPATMRIRGRYGDKAIVDFLDTYGKVVVKPLDRSLSLGLTTDVTTLEAVKTAILHATQYSDTALVQQQVFGEEIRFTVIDGRVRAALLRRTPRVVGDGIRTIRELVEIENEQRSNIQNTLVSYPQLDESVILSSVDMDRIPDKNEAVELSRSTMISSGCSVYDILEQVDPSYLEIVEKLVKDIEAGFIVVDIFVKDFQESATHSNYWFIEFNTSPVLKLFYSCRDGNMHDIVPSLTEAIDRKIHE